MILTYIQSLPTHCLLIHHLTTKKKKKNYIKKVYKFLCIGIVVLGPVAQTVRQSYPVHIYYINLLGNFFMVLLFSPSLLFFFFLVCDFSFSSPLSTFMLYNAKGWLPPSSEKNGRDSRLDTKKRCLPVRKQCQRFFLLLLLFFVH